MSPEYYERKIKKLERTNRKLKESMHEINYEIVNLLQGVFSMMDGYADSHSDRVADYAVIIAKNIKNNGGNIPRNSLRLHDLGKIGIPKEILSKPARLTDEEYMKMQKHTLIGSKIVSKIKSFQGTIDVIKFHHERWDGKGYPLGLKGEDIPISARVLAVADAFDAMTTDRPYRKKRSTEEAKHEILRNSGTQFDPKVVDAFIKSWEEIEKRSN